MLHHPTATSLAKFKKDRNSLAYGSAPTAFKTGFVKVAELFDGKSGNEYTCAEASSPVRKNNAEFSMLPALEYTLWTELNGDSGQLSSGLPHL